MPATPSRSSGPLTYEAALELVVSRITAAVCAGLRAESLRAPAYAVALWPQDEHEQLAPYPVSIGLEPDRQRALADLTGLQLFEAVWNASEFAIDGLELDEPPESADYRQAEEIAIAWLEKRDISNPGGGSSTAWRSGFKPSAA